VEFCEIIYGFPTDDDPTNGKKIAQAKQTGTLQVFCRTMDEKQLKERRKQPATPPKPVTIGDVAILCCI